MKRPDPLISILALVTLLLVSGSSLVLGVAAQDATPIASPAAPVDVTLIAADGSEVGSATFTENGDGSVTLSVSVEGLPAGDHGIHVHAVGVCDPEADVPFSSAGPHYNPTGDSHGGPDDPSSHAGDLGNMTIAEDGSGTFELTTSKFTLSEGPASLFDADGSALMIHSGADDLVTDPTGNSGSRIACGVVAEMPQPSGTPSSENTITGSIHAPEQVPFSEDMLGQLQLPDGFEISVISSGLSNPRIMVLAPDGTTLLVSQRSDNNVLALRDTDGDGVIDETETVASNLPYVHGLAIVNDQLYMAGEKTIWVADLADNGTLGEPQVLVNDLPEGGQHPNNTVALGPDGMLYIAIGSTCNACPETNPENATLLRMNPDGSGRTIFASGLRNTLGWGWHPDTGELWGWDMGSDWRGDDDPPDELNLITEGGNYGWPFCYADQQVDPNTSQPPTGASPEQYCANTEASVIDYQAHSSPIGFVYYVGDQFPEEYQGDGFVAMRGSWNRDDPTGYKIVHVNYEDGQPTEVNDFITGWLLDGGDQHFGRVAGLLVLPDGSLLIAEDTNGVIYRVTYTGGD